MLSVATAWSTIYEDQNKRETIKKVVFDNFLMAMETIYQHRFDDLDDTMCQVFELNQYASEEVKAKRSPHIKAYTES